MILCAHIRTDEFTYHCCSIDAIVWRVSMLRREEEQRGRADRRRRSREEEQRGKYMF